MPARPGGARLGLSTAEEIAEVCARVYGEDHAALPSHDDLRWQAQVVLDEPG